MMQGREDWMGGRLEEWKAGIPLGRGTKTGVEERKSA